MESLTPTVAQEAQRALEKLSTTSTKMLMSNGLQDWALLGNKLGFSTPLPERPASLPPPEAPTFDKPPREDDPQYTVDLTTLDKLLSSRRIKKQDAALKRFEKDRKAWNEDRDYALGIHERAKKQHVKDVEASETAYEAALDQWKRAFETYLHTLTERSA